MDEGTHNGAPEKFVAVFQKSQLTRPKICFDRKSMNQSITNYKTVILSFIN
jgi:hypothetical protein